MADTRPGLQAESGDDGWPVIVGTALTTLRTVIGRLGNHNYGGGVNGTCYECPFASEPLRSTGEVAPWHEVDNDPTEAHFRCSLPGRDNEAVVWGEYAPCTEDEWRAVALEALTAAEAQGGTPETAEPSTPEHPPYSIAGRWQRKHPAAGRMADRPGETPLQAEWFAATEAIVELVRPQVPEWDTADMHEDVREALIPFLRAAEARLSEAERDRDDAFRDGLNIGADGMPAHLMGLSRFDLAARLSDYEQAHGSAMFLVRAADRLAAEVDRLVRSGRLDARSEAADALLDYQGLDDHRARAALSGTAGNDPPAA